MFIINSIKAAAKNILGITDLEKIIELQARTISHLNEAITNQQESINEICKAIFKISYAQAVITNEIENVSGEKRGKKSMIIRKKTGGDFVN